MDQQKKLKLTLTLQGILFAITIISSYLYTNGFTRIVFIFAIKLCLLFLYYKLIINGNKLIVILPIAVSVIFLLVSFQFIYHFFSFYLFSIAISSLFQIITMINVLSD